MSNLAHEYLVRRLSYDPDTGTFTWRIKPRGAKRGQAVGGLDGKGYWRISLENSRYLAHRLAWFYVHGEWPQAEIDHINHNPLDNRIANLRPATRSQNASNTRGWSKTGLKGIGFHPKNGKWAARIARDGKRVSLGYFNTAEEAHAAYAAASPIIHGEFGFVG